jgi:diguanylate cyclase
MEATVFSPAVIIICSLFVLVAFGMAIGIGWWLRGRKVSETTRDDSVHTREALARLQELTRVVAADVGQHSSRVKEISNELVAKSDDESSDEAVLDTISQIIQANETMQQQLVSAEEKLKEQEQQIENHAAEARTDALTELANRRAFDRDLQQQFALWRRHDTTFSLMMIDVDHFKNFNDTYGHQAGDEVLRGVARQLQSCMREMDLVARYGGEEFAVIFPGSNLIEAKQAAERARKAIHASVFDFEGTKLQVTVSEGIAQVSPGEDMELLVKRADDAMYAAKQGGRNASYYHEDGACHPVIEPVVKTPAEPVVDEPVVETPPTEPANELVDKTPTASPKEESQDEAATSRIDTLTGLPNQATFIEEMRRRVAEWQRYGSPLSLMFIHVDDLPKIEDCHGKATSAIVLRTVTQFLQAAMREMDLVARYEEDCFSILLPGTRLQDAVGVAERLRIAIARCVLKSDGQELAFTTSIGVGEALTGDDLETLTEKASLGVRLSSEAGGNCTHAHDGRASNCITPSMESA